MTLLENLEAEERTPTGGWVRVSIDDALRHKPASFRCIACWGPMRAHKLALTGQRAHFEHHSGFTGCPRGDNFDGTARPHPDALT